MYRTLHTCGQGTELYSVFLSILPVRQIGCKNVSLSCDPNLLLVVSLFNSDCGECGIIQHFNTMNMPADKVPPNLFYCFWKKVNRFGFVKIFSADKWSTGVNLYYLIAEI